ncbi:MAG TPA: biotin/lipoyl-binding protein, partial [Xanthomonadaceae bacterium]|nr:biotin/lipoyl-binding protein [Xanthomonadaceae bacterium]
MTRLRMLAVLALVGFALAVWAVLDAGRKPPEPPPPATPQPPFADYVAGVGITETGRGNVAIGTPVAGIVREVDVRVGDRVSAGDLLFRIDDRDLQAQRRVALADAAQAEAAIS